MTKRKSHLVILIRYGRLDAFDAIDEIEKVMSKRKHAWFGKYGQPLNKRLEEIVERKNHEVTVFLIRKTKDDEQQSLGYRLHPYSLRSISRKIPEHKSEFPPYYLKHLGHISTWLLVEPYIGPKIELADLITKSSGMPVLNSLRSSMRGHFLCRLREGNQK